MISLSEGITPENLAALYFDPLISRTGDDHSPAVPVFHPLALYLSAWIGDWFVGAYLVIRYSETEFEAHCFLRRPATPYSRDFGQLLLDWVFSHLSVLRLTGYVREGLESARNHCLKMGFTQEGFRRDALMVAGQPKGLYVMGITRKEWAKS